MEKGWPRWGRTRDPNHWHPNADLNGLKCNDFNTYMQHLIHAHPGYVTNLYHGYTGCYVQFVGHQETLAQDLINVLHQLNVPFSKDKILAAGRINTSNTSHTIEWDSSLRRKVLKLEAAALARFGYDDQPP